MLFSTKAEYGVRLMVELGRRAGDDPADEAAPVALATVAESESLPLSYLEHLVAKLREAGLVSSVRGAHGGYRLAKAAEEIGMLDVVQALEGPITPMECFQTDSRGPRALFARVRRPPRLRDEAAVDPGPGRHLQGPHRHHAGGAGRVRRPHATPAPVATTAA